MAKINVFSEENNQIENKRQQNKQGYMTATWIVRYITENLTLDYS